MPRKPRIGTITPVRREPFNPHVKKLKKPPKSSYDTEGGPVTEYLKKKRKKEQKITKGWKITY